MLSSLGYSIATFLLRPCKLRRESLVVECALVGPEQYDCQHITVRAVRAVLVM